MAHYFLFNTSNTKCLLEIYIDFRLVEIQSKSFQTFLKQLIKLMFSKKAIKNYEIFTVDLTYLVSVKSTVKIL